MSELWPGDEFSLEKTNKREKEKKEKEAERQKILWGLGGHSPEPLPPVKILDPKKRGGGTKGKSRKKDKPGMKNHRPWQRI